MTPGKKEIEVKPAKGLAALDPVTRAEIIDKGHKARKEQNEKRRTMAGMFEEALTLERRKNIAESLVSAVANGTVKICDRIRILELILRLTGELPGGTTSNEIKALGDIVLKIN